MKILLFGISNVGKRITEDDTIYKDDDYKNQRRDYYMSDIEADLEW